MFRSFRTWAVALASGAALLTASPASAQFVNIPLGGGYNLYYSRMRAVSIPFMTPSGPATINYYSAFRPRPTVVMSPYYSGGYFGGGFSSGYNPHGAKNAADLAKAQRKATARAHDNAQRQITEQWAYERGARPINRPNDLADAAKIVDRNLLNANPADIASGKALNDLLQVIEPLQAKPGKLVDSSLLGPELLAKVTFTGSAQAEALNFLRAGRLHVPVPLRTRELAAWRGELEAAFHAVLLSAGEGKPLMPSVADRLVAAVQEGRELTAPIVRSLPFPQAAEVVRFLNNLALTAGVLRDPASAGLYKSNWSTLGLTVGELTTHMAKHGLEFAPSDAEAYSTLHRGMVGHYLALAQVRK
ncbi:MAG: hypothetical protein LC104_04840 [Bacteroidales bacterium]|nr:hypothetical protein [Bacteroidales bacterium]